MGGFWCLRVCTSTKRAPLSIKPDYNWLQTRGLQVELDKYWSKFLFADGDQMEKVKESTKLLPKFLPKKWNSIYTKKIVVHDHLWWSTATVTWTF